MAEGDEGGQDKTHDPTEKRLRESREQGQIPRSRELSTAAVFGASVLCLYSFGGWMGSHAADWLRDYLGRVGERVHDLPRLPWRFFEALAAMFLAASPIILAALAASLLAPGLFGGLHWAGKSLIPDFSKLDPIKGLERIYGREGVAELVRSLLRVAIIGGFGGYAISEIAPFLIALMHEPLHGAVQHGFAMAMKTLIAMGGGLLLLALIDAPYQFWSHKQKLMMSTQELRDEMKESEGSPEVKGKIRRLQQEMSQRAMMESVPKADAVLVNPTHYAVAIAYDPQKNKAPVVVAKGVDLIAQTIREIADRHKVPIVASPALARSLYRQVQIGREIPVNLYAAIAQVLTYVYQLRQWRRQGGRYPELPSIDVPDDERPR